jgi:hypothetical protein
VHSRMKFKFGAFALSALAMSLVIPVTPVHAASNDEANRIAAAQRPSGTEQTARSMNDEVDLSTNCEPGISPFVTGVIKDLNGNPLPRAKVIAKVFAYSNDFSSKEFSSDFSAWETKSDGSYSICSWDSAWSETYAQLRGPNFSLIITAVPNPDSNSSAMATTLAQATSGLAVVTQDVDPSCLKAVSVSTPCRVNVKMKAPIIQANVKRADGSAFSNSVVALEFKFIGKWTTLGEFATNNSGWFGFAGFVTTNSFRLRVMPPYCELEDSSQCPNQGLGSAADNFTATVMGGDPTTATALWLGSGTDTRDFVIREANFKGLLKSMDDVTITDGVQLIATQTSPERSQEAWIYGGQFGITLENGQWSLVAKSAGEAIMRDTTFTIGVTAGAITSIVKGSTTICSSATTSCSTSNNLPLDDPNFVALVKDDQGALVPSAWMYINKFDASVVSRWTSLNIFAESGNPNSEYSPKPAGLVGFQLPAPAILRLAINPPESGDTEVTAVVYYLKTTVDGAGIKVQRCADYNNDPQVTPCETGYVNSAIDNAGNTLSIVNGKRTLVMPTANFKGVVCAPGTGSACTAIGGGYGNVLKQVQSQCQNCAPNYTHAGISFTAKTGGAFSASITAAGKYRLELNAPRSIDGSSSTTIARSLTEFEAVPNGSGGFTYYTLDSAGTRTSQELATTVVPNKGSRILIRYLTPSLIGIVKAPDGTPNRNSGVDVQKDAPNICSTCREHVGHSPTDNGGVFALSLTVGRYYFYASPGYELAAQNLTRTEFKLSALDCNTDGSVELYTFASTLCNGAVPLTLQDGKVAITLLGANFAGVLRRPDTNAVIGNTSLSVQKWFTPEMGDSYWQWSNITGYATSAGVFGLNFGEVGRYRVTFNSPPNLLAQFSSSQIIVDVTGTAPFVVTPVVDSDVWSSNGDGSLNVKLLLPNASGTVSLPNSAQYQAGQFATVNVEKWFSNMCGNGCYSYSSDVNGISASANGDYAVSLPQGRWKLTFNPPYGTSTFAKVSREVVVTAQKTVCLLADSGAQFTTCPGSVITPGNLDVVLATPNFSGTVKNPNNSVSKWTSVQFSYWDSQAGYWQWANMYTNTDNSGKFGLNLTENKTYKAEFQPAFSAVGVSATTKFVRVCGAGATVEFIATEVLAKTGSTCTSSNTALRDQEISLLGANMLGLVKDAAGAPLANAWIAVQNCGAGGQNDQCQWLGGVNTKNTSDVSTRGKFDLRLDNDVSTRNVTKFVLEVNPPWDSAGGLVRLVRTVWVRDFTGDAKNDWCLNEAYTSGPGGGTCSNPSGESSSVWEITLSAGNLAGKVVAPTGATGVAGAQIQVEKWARPAWDLVNGQYGWQWSDTYANANQAGAFGLDIPTAGLYRLSVNPGWDNSAGFARRRYVIRVESNKTWCVKSGTTAGQPYDTSSAVPDVDSCTLGSDNESNDGVQGFTARVSNANLVGVLYNSSTDLTPAGDLANPEKKVRDSWIGLQKKHVNGWWEWQGGTNTSGSANSKGKFALNITEDGEYRLEFNPPWNTSGEDAGFRIDFTASNCSSTCSFNGISGSNVVANGDGTYAIKFPAPNFVGLVKNSQGTNPIAGSWISVSNITTGEWVAGVSTGWNGSSAGRFAMKLANGSYRVEVWPRWDDSESGIRRTLTVSVVNGAVNTCGPTDCLMVDGIWNIKLMGATVNAKVYYPGSVDGTDGYASSTLGNQTLMPWSWAEALSCSDADGTTCSTWVEGQSSNQLGILKMGLQSADNPYLIRIYPNWSMYAASPVELLVKITNGVATWKYRSESSGYVSDEMTPDFGRIPPNVTITVSGVDSSRFVDLYECDGSCSTGGTKIATVLTSYDGTAWKAKFLVSNSKSYRAVVITKLVDDLTNSRSITFTYDSSTKKFDGGQLSEFAHSVAI